MKHTIAGAFTSTQARTRTHTQMGVCACACVRACVWCCAKYLSAYAK